MFTFPSISFNLFGESFERKTCDRDREREKKIIDII